MKRLIYILLFSPLLGFGQYYDETFISEYCEIIIADTIYIGEYFDSVRVESPYLINKHDKLNTLTVSLYPGFPDIGTEVSKNKIYNYDSEAIQVIKTHTISVANPHNSPDMFSFYREETGNLEWAIQEKVTKRNIRIYNGVKYECIKDHMTAEGLEPDKSKQKLWKAISDCEEYDPKLIYNIGNCCIYKSKTYDCIIDKTNCNPDQCKNNWDERK